MKVLLIEDNPDHAFFERQALERDLDASVTVEARPGAGIERLREGAFDAVLLDYSLPEQDGLDVLKRIKELRADLPVILITAVGNEEVAVAAMKQGASDYLVKRFGGRDEMKIAAAVRRSIEQAELGRAYRRSQELLRKTLELAWDGVAYVNRRTCLVVASNRALGRMLGYGEGGLDGVPWTDVFAPDDRGAAERILDLDHGSASGPVEVEARLRKRDAGGGGSASGVHPVGVVLAELRAAPAEVDGEPCALVTVRDVSEKRRLQEQLLQAQKMEAVGTLAGGIAHDFNNLLGAILGYASYLKRHIRPEDRLFKSVETIESASERATELVRRILSFSRRGPSERHPFSPNQAVEETERLVLRSLPKSIAVRSLVDPGLPAVEGDETQIQQVLLNICINARDAMRDGGTLTLKTALAAPGEAPPALGPGPFVVLSVADTGVGMTPEVRSRMFEPFFTTKGQGKGTGLGLATAYAIVKAHGGAIEVESEVGRGTEVKVFLPASGKVPEATRPLDAHPERAGCRGTILVVDDEVAIRDLTTDILVERGYDVLLAASGDEALEILGRRGAEVDLVILDIIMPGMTGLDTLRRIHEIDPRKRVLLSSGYSPEGTQAEARAEGAAGFVQKPYRVADLSTAVRNALGGGGAAKK